jgi:hypothetical protein
MMTTNDRVPDSADARPLERAGTALVVVLALLFALAAGVAPVAIAVRLLGASAAAIVPAWGP